LDPKNRYRATNQAVEVPIIPENTPTKNIRKSVLEAYRGKVVDNKCGQIFSVGVNAIMKTDNMGAITNAAITNAFMDQTSTFFKNKILFLCNLSSIKMYLLKPNLHQQNVADDRVITKN
jgi:hypothetical protein|tara:strand:+ start:145 stop:501 length:357 start_codon:yes stop_codon:yes gene_type:complete